MPIYTIHDDQIKELKEKPFKLEKHTQKIFEDNLMTIMGLELVKSEFSIKNKRIDTLGFDTQSSVYSGAS